MYQDPRHATQDQHHDPNGVETPEIFSLEDAGEKGIVVRGNVPSRMGDNAFVNSIEVTEPAVLLRLANVFPGTESNRI